MPAPQPVLSGRKVDAMASRLRTLVDKHSQLTEELECLNPFRESDMTVVKPELEAKLVEVGDELANAVGELLEGSR